MNASNTIGPAALYLLLVWLISAAAAGWLSERKGYGERLGLTCGLVLSALGLVLVLFVLPGRPGSWWGKGWVPQPLKQYLRARRQRRSAGDVAS